MYTVHDIQCMCGAYKRKNKPSYLEWWLIVRGSKLLPLVPCSESTAPFLAHLPGPHCPLYPSSHHMCEHLLPPTTSTCPNLLLSTKLPVDVVCWPLLDKYVLSLEHPCQLCCPVFWIGCSVSSCRGPMSVLVNGGFFFTLWSSCPSTILFWMLLSSTSCPLFLPTYSITRSIQLKEETANWMSVPQRAANIHSTSEVWALHRPS